MDKFLIPQKVLNFTALQELEYKKDIINSGVYKGAVFYLIGKDKVENKICYPRTVNYE